MKFDWPIGEPTGEQKREADKKQADAPKTEAQKQANLAMTDPEVIGKACEAVIGSREFGEQIKKIVEKAYEERQVTTADRRHLVLPEASPQGGYTFRMLDLTNRTGWSNDAVRAARVELMGGWLRSVLCVKGFSFRSFIDKKSILEDKVGCEIPDEVARALSTDADEGGALMPTGFIPELIKDAQRLTQLWNRVKKISVKEKAGTQPLSAANARVFWGDEASRLTRGEPGYGNVPWLINRCGAFAEMSRELETYSNPDVVQAVSESFTEAIAQENDYMVAAGPGSDRPFGLYYASGVIDIVLSDLNYDALVKIKHSVNIRYHGRPGFMWVMNQTTYAACLMIKDDNGNPILVEARGAEPAKLLNVPFAVVNNLPNGFVGIGDWGYYMWFYTGTVAIERSYEAGDVFYTHQSVIKVVQYVDGRLGIPPTKPWARCRNFSTFDGGNAFPELENQDG